ncbi:TPR-like protein [Hyaloscypha variabilis F]|uniref:TPR-like protein n=1 Tax=Hyaloscypha variabilis (strain UAMH 11265 / GT02V1 / F) TaxID=1149755 RepID=A0A2J6RRK4_HYAVF|nr:TPR-like protein [Hyaloscypha variabilis F]
MLVDKNVSFTRTYKLVEMDLFEEPCFAAALPDGLTFGETASAPQMQQPCQDPFVFHEIPSGEPGIREMTRQQWETLKPLIQRVYIEENKPFPYLARILREEHNFEPSKRQFARQIEKWGFRKNVSSSERRRILQSLAGGMNEPVPELVDRRLKTTKLENWKRRYRSDKSEKINAKEEPDNKGIGMSATQGDFRPEPAFPTSEGGLSTAKTDLTIAEEESRHALESQEGSIAPVSEEKLDYPAKLLGLAPADDHRMEISQDSWPFDWSTVDVPGSPGLSRLFKRLEIESAAHVPKLSLDETESDDPSCLSSTEIQEVFGWRNETVDEVLYQVEWFTTASQESPKILQPQYPWRNIENVYCGYSVSPLTEIYVFPPRSPAQPSRKALRHGKPLWPDLKTQERELENRLTKLRAHFPRDHPATIAVIENLANILGDLENYEKAELIQRELLETYQRKLGLNNVKYLETSIRVAELLGLQGKYAQAERLKDSVRSRIKEQVPPYHPIALQVATNDALFARQLGRYEDAERIWREELQIILSTYGPRHWGTIEAMQRLGVEIFEQGKRGGDMLLRTAAQLSHEELDDGTGCLAMTYLSWGFDTAGTYEDSYNVATKALEQYSPLLGRNHRFILDLGERRAWSMLSLGKLTESEALFRDLLSRRDGASCAALANMHCGLGTVLTKMNRFEEATGWLEKSFRHRIEIYGPNNDTLRATYLDLSDRYEAQGRFHEALKVCQQMIDKGREVGGDNNEVVAELEAEFAWIEEKINEKSDLFSGSSEDDWVSDSTDDDDDEGKGSNEKIDNEQDIMVEEGEMELEGEVRGGENKDCFWYEDFPTL